MLAVLRQRNFGLLWVAGLISIAGDWMIVTALPFFIYAQTHSPLAVGGMFLVYFAPRVLVSPLAGVFVDRWNRKRTLVVADLVRVPVLLVLLTVTSPGQIWLIYVALFVESSVAQFFLPAKGALVPLLVRPEDLTTANALNALNNNLGRLIGAAVAGITLATFGLPGVALLDSATYLLSALLIAAVRTPHEAASAALPGPPHPSQSVSPKPKAALMQELRAGLVVISRDRVVGGLFVVFGVVNFADSITSLLFVAFVQDVLRAGASALGWFLAAGAAGGLLGGVFVDRCSRRVAPAPLIACGAVGVGLCFAVMFHLPSVALTLGLSFVMGLPLLSMNVSGETLLQTRVADRHRGRVLGVFGTVVGLLYVLGVAGVGLLARRVGLLPLLDGAIASYGLAGLLAWVLLGRVHHSSTAHVPVELQKGGYKDS